MGCRKLLTQIVATPPNCAPCLRVGKERCETNPAMKLLHNHRQDEPNTPSYVAAPWAHYKYKWRGPHYHDNVQIERKIQLIPTTLKYAQELHHSCGSQ